jgi:hypothetical protein
LDVRETRFHFLDFSDIPNPHRLAPQKSHPAHDLFRGMLLEPRGITRSGKKAKVCGQCLESLKDDKTTPPLLSLANNLWVGRVPWELETLSFGEQLVISPLFCRSFIIKLWPTSGEFNFDTETLQRGLRGNVTTFELDHEAITSMICGRIMPRPVSTLASIIIVTVVGRGSLPKKYLRSLFRIRRRVVYLALVWLKKNNPHFAHIQIDEARLQSLPEDDVPEEILDIVRQNTDVGVIDDEKSGYVPSENHDENGKCKHLDTHTSNLTDKRSDVRR